MHDITPYVFVSPPYVPSTSFIPLKGSLVCVLYEFLCVASCASLTPCINPDSHGPDAKTLVIVVATTVTIIGTTVVVVVK